DAPPPDLKVQNECVRRFVGKLVHQLPDKERLVIQLRYGFNVPIDGIYQTAPEPMIMPEIGKIMGVSKQRIDQIHQRALQKLTRSLRIMGKTEDASTLLSN